MTTDLKIHRGRLFLGCSTYTDEREWVDAKEYERLDIQRLQAVHERDCAVEDVKRLHDGIDEHMRTVCNNPKEAGRGADEKLWALVTVDVSPTTTEGKS